MALIRVWSPEGEPGVAYRNEFGALVPGRYIAKEKDGSPMPDGEEVQDTIDVRRDIRRGHLTTSKPGAV